MYAHYVLEFCPILKGGGGGGSGYPILGQTQLGFWLSLATSPFLTQDKIIDFLEIRNTLNHSWEDIDIMK